MAKVSILNHPLINHKLTIIRDKKTTSKEFYDNVKTISSLMAYEIFKDLELGTKTIETPICKTKQPYINKDIIIVPILRAGLAMLDGIREVVPFAKVGFIGMYRDEKTLKPKDYLTKIPDDLSDSIVLLVDPMLATGNSSLEAIKILKNHNAKNIKYAAIISSKNGIEAISKVVDVNLYVATCDNELNENGYIVPGLGDCGDRMFGD